MKHFVYLLIYVLCLPSKHLIQRFISDRELCLYLYEYQKWIDKTDYCPKCGKEVHVISKEK